MNLKENFKCFELFFENDICSQVNYQYKPFGQGQVSQERPIENFWDCFAQFNERDRKVTTQNELIRRFNLN